MSINGGIVTAPVSNGDLATALNYASGDIRALYTYGVINWWSKAKPFNSSWHESDKSKTREQARKEVNQSFDIGSMYSSASAALDAAIALGTNVFAWSYVRPQTNKRYLDMDGYNMNKDNYTNCPFKYRPQFNAVYDGDTLPIDGQLEFDWSASDFATLDGWNLGVAFRREGTNITTWFTLDTTTSIPSTYFSVTGTYHFCIFFTNVSKAINANDLGASFYLTPLPYAGAVTRGSGSGVTISSSGEYGADFPTRKTINGIILRSLGRGRRITNVQFVWRTSASRVWSSAGSGEGDGNSYDAIDIPLESTHEFGIVSVTGSGMLSGNLYMRFYINGGQDYLLLVPKSSFQPDLI